MRAPQLREGRHLPPLRAHPLGAADHHARTIKKRRNLLVLPTRTTPWAAFISEALKQAFGEDDLGGQELALFQSTLQPGTLKNYGSNLTGFLEFYELYPIDPPRRLPRGHLPLHLMAR